MPGTIPIPSCVDTAVSQADQIPILELTRERMQCVFLKMFHRFLYTSAVKNHQSLIYLPPQSMVLKAPSSHFASKTYKTNNCLHT